MSEHDVSGHAYRQIAAGRVSQFLAGAADWFYASGHDR